MHQHQMTHSRHNQKVTVNTEECLSKSVASMARTKVTAAYGKQNKIKQKLKKGIGLNLSPRVHFNVTLSNSLS